MKMILILLVRFGGQLKFILVKDKWNQISADFMAKNVRDIGNWEGLIQERHRKYQEQFDRVIIAK